MIDRKTVDRGIAVLDNAGKLTTEGKPPRWVKYARKDGASIADLEAGTSTAAPRKKRGGTKRGKRKAKK